MAPSSRKPSRKPAPRSVRGPAVYDKAKWHSEGQWPRGLDPQQAFVPTGMYLGWLVERGLSGDGVPPTLAAELKARRMSGPELYEACGGVLSDELLNDEGRRFTAKYLKPGTYASDYAEVLAREVPSAYHVRYTRQNYLAIATRLDERLVAFRAARSRAPVKPAGSEVDARLRKLQARAKKNDVQVEHLLAFAALGDPKAAAAIRSLKEQHAWPMFGRNPETRVREFFPLGRWADYVCTYLESGFDGLLALALSPEEAARDRVDESRTGAFALAILEEVRTVDSVRSVVTLIRAAEETDNHGLAIGCADALNDLLVFKPAVAIDSALAADVREFLHRLLGRELTTPELANVYGALRAVGDEQSLALIEQRPPAPPPWQELQQIVIKAIKQRQRASGG